MTYAALIRVYTNSYGPLTLCACPCVFLNVLMTSDTL